jgi:hypothetical protein
MIAPERSAEKRRGSYQGIALAMPCPAAETNSPSGAGEKLNPEPQRLKARLVMRYCGMPEGIP